MEDGGNKDASACCVPLRSACENAAAARGYNAATCGYKPSLQYSSPVSEKEVAVEEVEEEISRLASVCLA